MLGYLKCHADDSNTTMYCIGDHLIISFTSQVFIIENYLKIEIFLLSCQKMMCSKACVCAGLAAGWHHETIYRAQVAPPLIRHYLVSGVTAMRENYTIWKYLSNI